MFHRAFLANIFHSITAARSLTRAYIDTYTLNVIGQDNFEDVKIPDVPSPSRQDGEE